MKPYWTIPEACVWAATSDFDAVDAMRDDPEAPHALLADTPIEYGAHVAAWRSQDGQPPAAWAAFKQIPKLCASGRLTMRGLERGEGDWRPIEKDAWEELKIFTRGLEFVASDIDPIGNPSARWWSRLKMPSEDVLSIWPQNPAGLPSTPQLGAAPSATDATSMGRLSPAKLQNAFETWSNAQRAAGVLVTESDAMGEMTRQVGDGVTRAAIRKLIAALPDHVRSPANRPPKAKRDSSGK